MLWFTGAKVVSAYAQTVDVRGLKYPDIGQTMYRFDSGATATLETGLVHARKNPLRHRRAHVDHWHRRVHPHPGHLSQHRHLHQGRFRSPDTTYWPALHGRLSGALREEFLYFARCIRENTPPTIITPAESMEAVRTTLAAERSAETGEVVRLD